jgi:hypothetical protein
MISDVQRSSSFWKVAHLNSMLALVLLSACTPHHEVTYRIILPDQYVGWVRIDFEVRTPPAFDSQKTVTFRVGGDGRCQDSSVMVSPTKYEFFYETKRGLNPVREDFVDHEMNAGGITANSDDPHYGTSWSFFVGPKWYRDRHPNSEFASHSSPLPAAGPLALQQR